MGWIGSSASALIQCILMRRHPYTNLAEVVDNGDENGDDNGDIVMTKILRRMISSLTMHTDETPYTNLAG